MIGQVKPFECAQPCGKKGRDLTGEVFGRLTVVAEKESRRSPDGKQKRIWLCRCECGKETTVFQGNLVRCHTLSCGCHKREVASRSMTNLSTTHGQARTRLYGIWLAMRKRCGNSNHPHYARYGGRGIKVCGRWKDFPAFRDDMGEPPSARHTLERKNNDLGYDKENCTWATMREQANNKSSNVLMELDGWRQTVAQWARETGKGESTIRERRKRGWSDQRALTTPVKGIYNV